MRLFPDLDLGRLAVSDERVGLRCLGSRVIFAFAKEFDLFAFRFLSFCVFAFSVFQFSLRITFATPPSWTSARHHPGAEWTADPRASSSSMKALAGTAPPIAA
jgi:hypothetical protein